MAALVGLLAAYQYPIVVIGTILQGPVIMLGGGFLLRLGTFDFWPLYFSLLVGDFIGDIIWYWIGRSAAEPFLRRFGHIFGVTRRVFEKMENAFHQHDAKILFISKVTMGFGFALATLMAAGATKVPFKKYLILNLLGGFIWTGLLVFVGYFFGNFYYVVDESLRTTSLIASLTILLLLVYGFGSYIRAKYNRD